MTDTRTLLLYGGTGCHLCEQARARIEPLLEEGQWQCREVNIRGDVELEAAYGLRIPVLRLPSGVEKNWPFTVGQLRRLLERELDQQRHRE